MPQGNSQPPPKKKALRPSRKWQEPYQKTSPAPKRKLQQKKKHTPTHKKKHTHTHRTKKHPKHPKHPKPRFFLTGPSYDPTSARSDCGYRYASPLRCCLHPARSEPVGPGSMGERKSRGKGEGGASLTSPKNDDLLNSICWVWPLPRMPVTTRSMTFLAGNPNLNLYLPLLLGGGHTQSICV